MGRVLKWYRTNWYFVGGGLALIVFAVLLIEWDSLDVLQRVLLAVLGVLMLHQFEEYGWPGGEPAVMNKAMQPSDAPDRYPLNQNSAMIVNAVVGYPWLLLPVFFPGQIWFGLAAGFFFGFGQLVVHGVVANRKLRTLYNPGFLTVLIGFLPLGIYYVYDVESKHLASVWDWVGAVVATAVFMFLSLGKMTYNWLADKNSPYPFTHAEMKRWNVDQRLARLTHSDA